MNQAPLTFDNLKSKCHDFSLLKPVIWSSKDESRLLEPKAATQTKVSITMTSHREAVINQRGHMDSLHLNQKCFVFLFLKSGDSSLTLVAKCSVLGTSWRQQYIWLYVNKFICALWVQQVTFMNEEVMHVQTWFLQINQNFAPNKY